MNKQTNPERMVYIVMGERSSFSDSEMWLVRAWDTLDAAQADVEACDAEVRRRLRDARKERHAREPWDTKLTLTDAQRAIDPRMGDHTSFDLSPTPTYDVTPLPISTLNTLGLATNLRQESGHDNG